MRREGKEGWDREWERIGERDRKITSERDKRRERREGVSQVYWTDIAIYKRASLSVTTCAGRGTSRLRWQCVLPSARGGDETCQMALVGHLMKSCQMVRVAGLSEALVRSCATGSAPAS